jgi:hypothetical protein
MLCAMATGSGESPGESDLRKFIEETSGFLHIPRRYWSSLSDSVRDFTPAVSIDAAREVLARIESATVTEDFQRNLDELAAYHLDPEIRKLQHDAMRQIARGLREERVPTAEELQATAEALVQNVPKAPREEQQLEKAVAEIEADSKVRSFIRRIVDGLESVAAKLAPAAAIALSAWLVFHLGHADPTAMPAAALVYVIARDILAEQPS